MCVCVRVCGITAQHAAPGTRPSTSTAGNCLRGASFIQPSNESIPLARPLLSFFIYLLSSHLCLSLLFFHLSSLLSLFLSPIISFRLLSQQIISSLSVSVLFSSPLPSFSLFHTHAQDNVGHNTTKFEHKAAKSDEYFSRIGWCVQ